MSNIKSFAGYRKLNGVRIHRFNRRTDFDSAILCDLDNTLADSRAWFGSFIIPALEELAHSLGMQFEVIARAYVDQALESGLHEDAFLVEKLVARCACDIEVSDWLVQQSRAKFWNRFDRDHLHIRTFPGVVETLRTLKRLYPRTAFIVCTDAPRDTAQERLALITIEGLIDGLIAVESPLPPRDHRFPKSIRDSEARIQAIDHRFNSTTRQLMLDVEVEGDLCKPSPVGPGLVLELLRIDPDRLVLIGDSPGKEGQAGHAWEEENGVARGTITSVSCAYGQHLCEDHHEAARVITSLPKEPPTIGDVEVHSEIHRFCELLDVVDSVIAEQQAVA